MTFEDMGCACCCWIGDCGANEREEPAVVVVVEEAEEAVIVLATDGLDAL